MASFFVALPDYYLSFDTMKSTAALTSSSDKAGLPPLGGIMPFEPVKLRQHRRRDVLLGNAGAQRERAPCRQERDQDGKLSHQ